MAWGRDTALPEGAEGVSQGAQRTLGCRGRGSQGGSPSTSDERHTFMAWGCGRLHTALRPGAPSEAVAGQISNGLDFITSVKSIQRLQWAR